MSAPSGALPTVTLEVRQQLQFEMADFYVANNVHFSSTLAMDQRVALYAYRQQVLVGPCNTPKPGFFELVEEVKERWAAWDALGTMPVDAAADRFVKCVADADPQWESWDGFPELHPDDVDALASASLYAA